MLTLRAASTDDLAALATLHAVVHDTHARHRPDLFTGEPSPDALEALLTTRLSEPDVTFLLAETPGGEALGYAMARVVRREGSTLLRPETFLSLQQIAVAPGASRGGVGSALLEGVRALGRAAGCRRLVTDVWDFNEGARAFYRARGFRPLNSKLEQEL
ncbi:N-acetyltransferase family protein [Streptomyces angustmyceticus]|uniref:GNAT family N-acetyltransferase n=1 Tax=Streptomyces angustmyceticus TaxID=285578 RepID=UPI0021AFC385|nr:GNAT family N-acetyltransferase [Streptomyces angustmyceticus]